MDLGQRIGDLSPEQRKLLELKLRQQKIDVLQIPITREYRKDVDQIPLSFGQERLWFIHQLEPHNAAYNLIRATKLEGNLKFSALARGIDEIICRHEILRTVFRFESTKPVQVILPTLSLTLERIDLEGLSKDGQEARVKQIIRDESLRPFDLSTGPLLRVKLLGLGDGAHVFLLVVHHIVADGTSIQIFIRELAQLYQAFSRGEPSPLPGLSIQYADYANWQRRWFKDGEAELPFKKKQEAFWLKQFSGKIPVLTLPTDYPRPAVQGFAGSTIVFSLDSHEAAILTAMALKEKTTLYVVLLSIYTVFLSRLSGQEDVIVGTPVAGRRHPTVQRLIGMFVNTLALRNFPRHGRRFIDFLREVVNRTLDAFENQEYRYEDILGKIDIERDTSRNPLFDVMLMLKNVDYAEVNIPGLALRHYEYDSQTSKFDLTLSAWEDQDTLYFSFEYCTALFQETTIRRFIGSFKRIVRSLVEDAGMKISEIEIAAEEEQRKVLYDFNRTDSEYPADKTVQQLLEEQVDRTPDRAALIFENKQLTYKGLNGKANCLAVRLTARGARPLMVVGIYADRSLELMTAIFAVLKAGCAYLPLDPSHPERRVKYMLTASSAAILLTHKPRLWGGEFDFIDLNEEEDDRGDAANPGMVNSPTDPAYVIYTSGTTGVPKGVVIEHRPVANFIKGMTDLIDFRCRDRILSLTTVSFDIFGLETLVPLTRGAAVVMGNSEEQLDPGAAASVINREKITIFQVTPSRLQLFFSPNQANPIKELATLRYLLVGGEPFPGRLLEQVRPLVKAKIFNLYGPTETTIWSTARDLSGEAPLDIGRPIANTRVYILDKNLKSVPIGVRGEIYIGGSGVARGYLNSPELTAERFITAPTSSRQPPTPKSQILYRTGDLGRWLPDGHIECSGRIDHQLKIRGYRIESAEIEGKLVNHEAINEAVVMARENEGGNKFLCAFYVKAEGTGKAADLDASSLREFLSADLPDYMIPSYFIRLEQIPLTPNKKIDRKALLKYDIVRPHGGGKYLAPQTELEEKIADCWEKVLQLDQVGIHDNFFDLGGSSMEIIQLANELKPVLGTDITVVSLFRHLTIGSFARYLMEQGGTAQPSPRAAHNQEALRRAKNIFKNTVKKTLGGRHV